MKRIAQSLLKHNNNSKFIRCNHHPFFVIHTTTTTTTTSRRTFHSNQFIHAKTKSAKRRAVQEKQFDFDQIFDIMSDNENQDSTTLRKAFDALLQFSQQQKTFSLSQVQLMPVISCMEMNIQDEHIVLNGMNVLSGICGGEHEGTTIEVMSAGGVELVVTVLQNYSNNVTIVTSALQCLDAFTSTPFITEFPALNDIVEYAVKELASHDADSPNTSLTLRILFQCSNFDEGRTMLHQIGGTQVIMSLKNNEQLKSDSKSRELITVLLTNLTRMGEDTIRELYNNETIEFLIESVKTLSDPVAISYSYAALYNIASIPEYNQSIARSQVIDLALDSIQKHFENVYLVGNCLTLLSRLTNKEEQLSIELSNKGGISLCFALLSRYEPDGTICLNTVSLLSNLLRHRFNEEDYTRVVDANGIELLAHIVVRHQEEPLLVAKAALILAHYIDIAGDSSNLHDLTLDITVLSTMQQYANEAMLQANGVVLLYSMSSDEKTLETLQNNGCLNHLRKLLVSPLRKVPMISKYANLLMEVLKSNSNKPVNN
jgi:hypothetical protein